MLRSEYGGAWNTTHGENGNGGTLCGGTAAGKLAKAEKAETAAALVCSIEKHGKRQKLTYICNFVAAALV